MPTVIDLPNLPWNAATWGLERDDTVVELGNGAEVVVESPRAKWRLTLPLALVRRENFRAIEAALIRLARSSVRFQAGPPDYVLSTGYIGAQPRVAGGGQLGNTLQADGVSASTLVAQAGDYIGVNGQVLMLVADAGSNASGELAFTFEPSLREAPDNDAFIELNSPRCLFRLRNPEAFVNLNVAKLRNTTFDAIETFDP